MKTRLLKADAVLEGYDRVCALYAHIPPLSHWRAWEYAAYQAYRISGRVLDLGCGDGRYFRLIWPDADNVVGVDMNADVAALGRSSGVYRVVYETPAHRIPEQDESFDHVFANCSLEHMDALGAVLAEVFRCLKPGGTLLCSVVTEENILWALLPRMLEAAGYRTAATRLMTDYVSYHNLVNPLSVTEWVGCFARAGFVAEEHVPLLPLYNSGIWTLMDGTWHVKKDGGGELGELIYPFLTRSERFSSGFRKVLAGLMEMETRPEVGSGAVFLLRKPEGQG